MSVKKLNFPATERNKDPILKVLKEVLVNKFLKKDIINVLEIASGSGQHAVYFAQNLPHVEWQPTDIDENNLLSIKAYINELPLKNIKIPIKLDISKELQTFPAEITSRKFDVILCANLVHISPWNCTEGLFRSSAALLNPGGVLFTYGPYAHHGRITPESNVNFDLSLKARNAEWGLRDTDDMLKEAVKNSFCFDAMYDMPSNNHSIIYVYQGSGSSVK